MVADMRYAVVIEQAEGNYSAYVPDLPGCVTTGATLEETVRYMREAIAFLHMAFDAGAALLEDSADDLTRETALL